MPTRLFNGSWNQPRTKYAVRHAPHNMTIGGKLFKGGQFIPSGDFAKATPEQKKAIMKGKSSPAIAEARKGMARQLHKAHRAGKFKNLPPFGKEGRMRKIASMNKPKLDREAVLSGGGEQSAQQQQQRAQGGAGAQSQGQSVVQDERMQKVIKWWDAMDPFERNLAKRYLRGRRRPAEFAALPDYVRAFLDHEDTAEEFLKQL